MLLDGSGNLGLGVTPSAWNSSQWSVFEGAYGGALAFYKASNVPVTVLTSNAFYDSSWKYKTTDPALQYEMDGNVGIHKWYTAPSGTAGNTISFTQAMDLANSSGASTLTVNSAINTASAVRLTTNGGLTAGMFLAAPAADHSLGFQTAGSERARITSGGNLLVGTTTDPGGSGKVVDSNGNVRAIPQSGSAKTTSYTLATGDVGEYIQVGSGGSITIPDATFASGDVVSVFNNTSGTITITCSITTAYIAGTDSDKATMTLASRGVATILFISGTVCVVSGNVT
jgi:hypothetical protein